MYLQLTLLVAAFGGADPLPGQPLPVAVEVSVQVQKLKNHWGASIATVEREAAATLVRELGAGSLFPHWRWGPPDPGSPARMRFSVLEQLPGEYTVLVELTSVGPSQVVGKFIWVAASDEVLWRIPAADRADEEIAARGLAVFQSDVERLPALKKLVWNWVPVCKGAQWASSPLDPQQRILLPLDATVHSLLGNSRFRVNGVTPASDRAVFVADGLEEWDAPGLLGVVQSITIGATTHADLLAHSARDYRLVTVHLEEERPLLASWDLNEVRL